MRIKTKKKAKGNTLVQDIRQLFKHINNKHQRHLVALLALMVLSSLSEMISLGALLPFLSALSNPEELLENPRWQVLITFLNIETVSQLVVGLALVFVFAAIISNSLRFLTVRARVYLSAAIGCDISCKIFHKTLQQPYQFHARHNSSDLMQTLLDDTNRLTTRIITPLLTAFTDGILVFSLIWALILIDAPIAISAAAILGSAYLVTYRLRQRILKRNSKLVSQSGQRRIKTVQESIGGIRDVLIAHTYGFFENEFQNAELKFKNIQAQNAVISQSPKFLIEAITMAAIALLSVALGRNGDFSQAVPVLGSLALGAKRLLPALQSVFLSIAQVQGSRTSLERVLVALKRSIDFSHQKQLAATRQLTLERGIRVKNVWFRYTEDGDWVLKNLNLKIAAKTTIGFVGTTGSGKSTTADLILGLLRPQKGTVWVDDQVLEGDSWRQWQSGIAHVPQHIFLTDASIAENIAFAIPKAEIDFERVQNAARLAQVSDFIDSLPAKYDTYVGERGVRLSGGQRQRIGIARALYRQASVIVFDEATSALDNATEKEVMDAINRLSHKFTIILIAHRLSTVEKCDTIFELHQGSIVAKGSYKELLNLSQSFRSMVQASK
ncbi:ABC transporter ATP-binding protein [Oscillatoria sp. CS-180]|uniref:ABC transporter ATP-binding protein n=1 Tax=Oscillatoria sp. CS-180 TaxID=3021720 RepID=UPI00232ADEFB|nr:ABC transporter ATP-binding protein [Oscillatoria sp. CS-180]MDB9526437.1 ABC transporter ATP-binding protein [Oscillatoria sp. CS-180]